MPDLLLEILGEEIPARMQKGALAELCRRLGKGLAAAGIPAERSEGFVTPRRLALLARGIPARQAALREERRGPRVGAPTAAIEGFLRASGLASIKESEIRELQGGRYHFAVKEKPGEETAKILPQIVLSAIADFPWPKSMRFPSASLRWVRPINRILALFDGEILPIALGEIPVGRVTHGHRFLSPRAIRIESVDRYKKRLEEAFVVLDPSERLRMIREGLEACASMFGFRVKEDSDLLEEVCGLVEYPVVLSGAIEAPFMSLPPEVLAAAMRTHQRYFSCLDEEGRPAPRFLFVANNKARDGGKAIVVGNERVLRARLADARYFFDQDRKSRLEERIEALKSRVYHEKLGSVYDKARRMESVARDLAGLAFPGSPLIAERAARAALLAKADLSTQMVGEFPELQGIMGGYYAREDGEKGEVAEAIADHYKPLGASDSCPSANESVLLALADKIDTLVAFFSIEEKPSGSGDPYALRRAALGLIRIILDKNLPLRLYRAFYSAAKALSLEPAKNEDLERALPRFAAGLGGRLLSFVVERLKVHLRGEGFRLDVIDAALAPAGEREDHLPRLVERVSALRDFLGGEAGANLLLAYRRASNIVRIEGQKGGWQPGETDSGLFHEEEEKALWRRLDKLSGRLEAALAGEDFVEAMTALATLRHPVDDFFEKVTVNAKEPELRQNRLRLLAAIRGAMNRVADFSRIEG